VNQIINRVCLNLSLGNSNMWRGWLLRHLPKSYCTGIRASSFSLWYAKAVIGQETRHQSREGLSFFNSIFFGRKSNELSRPGQNYYLLNSRSIS
jgi:hypothetical protein